MNATSRGVLAALFLTSAGLTACESAPTSIDSALQSGSESGAGGAERLVWIDFYDMTDSHYTFACDEQGNYLEDEGELVRAHGGIYSRFVATITPTGNVLVNYHTMPVGLGGVGVDSGEPFRIREADHGNSAMTAMGHSNSFRQTLTLVGTETGRRMRLVYAGNYRVTGDRIIVEHDRVSLECRV